MLSDEIVSALPFGPNSQQLKLIDALARYVSSAMDDAMANSRESVFILNGYAGTGKTSVVGALVKALRARRTPAVLAAPTGRAAKVFSSMAGEQAHTIHRLIYRPPAPGVPAVAGLRSNRYPAGTVFIIDEASMISGSGVLTDLIEYVFSVVGNRLVFVGDTAQLPPVGCSDSPAMQPATFRAMGISAIRATVTATQRQRHGSGILYNATMLRRAMAAEQLPATPPLRLTGFDDVGTTDAEEFQADLSAAYSRYGVADTILITRSNRRAVDYNRAIRGMVFEYDELLVPGEPLLVTKNDYLQASADKRLGFIANGDIAFVEKVYGTETVGYLLFGDVRLHFPDKEVSIDAKLLLSTLDSDCADISPAMVAELNRNFGGDPAAMRTNRYYNALHVKYAYAVTCHKAQGGQWSQVFVDMGFLPAEALTAPTFYRWLYTAVTRARRRLTIVT